MTFTEHEAEAKDIYGWSPYHYASLEKTQDLVVFLLWGPTSRPERLPKLLSNLLRSPMHIAALGGLADNLNAILDELATDSAIRALQASGIDGMTVIHLLARQGVFDSSLVIHKKGEANSSLTKKDLWGRQALHIAVKYGNQDFAKKLLGNGARSDEPDEWGMSPIDYFLERRKEKDPQANPQESVTPSEIGSDTSNNAEASSSYMNKEESTNFLTFAMENTNCRYGDGRTFLHIAIEVVDEDSIRTLLAKGFDLEARDAERRTPLHCAIHARRKTLALTLIEGVNILVGGVSKRLKAGIAAKDSHDTTALMFAARANLEDVVKAMLNADPPCDVTEVDDEGYTALHHARDVNMARLLVDKKSDPTVRDSIKRTPLHRAIERGNSDLAEYLLTLRDPKQSEDSLFDKNKESILVTACRRGLSSLIIEILRVWPGIIDTEDATCGQTPIAWACEHGHKDVVTTLIGQGANVNKPAAKWGGYTPLHICVLKGDLDILKILLEKEVDLQAKSIYAQTPLEFAIESKSVDITRKLLLDHRTSVAERITSLKEMVSKHSEKLQAVIWQGLDTILNQSHILETLIWLFTRQPDADRSESDMKVEREKATNLLTPLARDIENKSWDLLKSPLNSNALFRVKDISVMLEGQQVDATGLYKDGWSYVDYIDRSQGSTDLKDVVKILRELRPNDKDRHMKPTAFKWAEYGEYIQLSPCNIHKQSDCYVQSESHFAEVTRAY